MALLTSEERKSCFKGGVRYGIVSQRIVYKLNSFQKAMTDELHVAKINNLIQFAEVYADENATNTDEHSKLFHQRMNYLTKQAGLRC